MNELDVDSEYDHYFQDCILSGYKEAVADKNAPIHLHLSHFNFDDDNAEDLVQIWTLNTSRARSLTDEWWGLHKYVPIRSQDASFADCHGPGPVALPARKDPGSSTLDDEEGVRSSTSCIEFDLSSCHSLERLKLSIENVIMLPNALVGLKKLKHLEIRCKYEALDLSHFEHIDSIDIRNVVHLLPLSITNYKTLKCIAIHTTYDGLDLSMFENLNSIAISNEVNVLPIPLVIHNKITHIGFNDFDFNCVDNKAIHAWYLLNGADPVQCAYYIPVLPSIEDIEINDVTCFSTWLRSLFSTMLTLDHRVKCRL
ncbi:hypothetical protein DPMN_060194 [Dreissena polymorpha]|uniref:Uncharacterized protein n=1 Tax=Dreissena polymorpha TaxID=45954 RepID=A0A9D4HHC0_DREPO|nr:hypothetical protein DPMN_060194 [Dreissena polymorpha]